MLTHVVLSIPDLHPLSHGTYLSFLYHDGKGSLEFLAQLNGY
jgi:hypothetical protein